LCDRKATNEKKTRRFNRSDGFEIKRVDIDKQDDEGREAKGGRWQLCVGKTSVRSSVSVEKQKVFADELFGKRSERQKKSIFQLLWKASAAFRIKVISLKIVLQKNNNMIEMAVMKRNKIE
jgi:hypothetical protein